MSRVLKRDLHWYAFRVLHNKVKPVKEWLDHENIEYFVPTYPKQKEKGEVVISTEEPIIPSLIFIRSTNDFVKTLKDQSPVYLNAYTNPGTRDIAIIPNYQMDSFIYVLSKGCQQVETIDEKLIKGNQVRITGGLFEGAEGYITRVHGTKRFVVLLKGIAAVATTFIPRCYIEKIE